MTEHRITTREELAERARVLGDMAERHHTPERAHAADMARADLERHDRRTTRVYVVTHNLTGYLPESAPFYTTDKDSAYAYALDEIDARLDDMCQMPDEYRDDAWAKEYGQYEDIQASCKAARDARDIGWSDCTIGTPWVTFSVESFVCESASDLASWVECSLADLELADTATIDDVCETLNQEGW